MALKVGSARTASGTVAFEVLSLGGGGWGQSWQVLSCGMLDRRW